MTDHLDDGAFALTINDVFTLVGRGIAVIGPVEAGVIRSNDAVEIWDGDQVVTTAYATVELINKRSADPRSVALVLRNVEGEAPVPGWVVRSRVSRP